jgi:hypothetical protein
MYGYEPLTPKDAYADYIRRIDRLLRILFPKAKMIFATSTNVQEEKYKYPFVRFNSDIVAYNAAAKNALASTDTVINDLYALTENIPHDTICDK